MVIHVFAHGGDQLLDAMESSATDALVGQFAEPSLDQVQPGRTGGSEVQMKAGVLAQPAFDLGMFVGSVVVEDQVQVQSRRCFAVDFPQEL